ncbi:MAG: biosynthetic-type acetolactate synthase large subunit [Chitinophagales bacterium]|nr:biosynthetic-type acetolactate synthase large subunit [Bacteroidota bacterium]MCB9042351.1 biosynthetic-type acetolactate synthase large subunit [Chitinophagales bacterium]
MQENFITGAEAVMRSLIQEGVDTIFGYPGGAIMPIYDALFDYTHIVNHILVRHEQGAIHAAQGYARASGKVGVCFATSGPGATNLITGLADAQIDSTPLVCISGQVASHLLGTDAFQETDVIGISMPITKWNLQVTDAKDIPDALARAFYIARSGRPGPVLIDITKDAQFGKLHYKYEKCTKIRSFSPVPSLNIQAIEEAAALINKAQKPYILVGQGVILSKAEKALLMFAEKTGIPVAATLLGLGAFPAHHPQYVGYLGMHGNYAPNVKTNECDVLIAIGMRFDDRVTGNINDYARQAKIIHIDIDKAEINKIIPVNVAIHADAKEALEALIDKIEIKNHTQWINEFNALKEKEYEVVIRSEINVKEGALKMAEVIHLLSEKTNGNAIIVTDVGQHQMVTSRYFKYNKRNGNITSGGLGTMGFALPAAIGAKIAKPNDTVIAIIGDGGFQMTMQELGTILQSDIAVKIIVLNNNFLGMVRQWQQLFFDKRYSFTDLVNPNFVAIAKAYNIESQKIERRQDLDTALENLLTHSQAYLLEVVVVKEENVFPMVPTGASVSEIRLN